MTTWIDVHTHLNMIPTPVEETLRLAEANGVNQVITIGTTPDDLPLVLKFAEDFFPQVVCTLGIHPHDAKLFNPEVAEFIRANASRKEVVAVGEIGLDYYYDNSPRDIQLSAFEAQLKLAAELKLPVEIHTRDAEEDTVRILKSFQGRVTGLMHCFTGTQWLADQCLALGFNISISGVVTFKNADALRSIVRTIPLNRLHVETDAPFLAPIPQRGKKNTSAFVVHTAQCIADLKGISMEELSRATNENARRLFKKLP